MIESGSMIGNLSYELQMVYILSTILIYILCFIAIFRPQFVYLINLVYSPILGRRVS